VHPAATLLPAARTVCPTQRLSPEPTRELRTSGVRRLGHLGHRFADLQARARRQAVDRQVKVDDQLIPRKLPAVATARDSREHPAVHDGNLPQGVGPAVASAAASPRLPIVPAESMGRVEDTHLENLSLFRGRPTDDHLDDAGIRRRGPDRRREPLELDKPTMVGNVLGEFLRHAGFDRAHKPLPPVDPSSEKCRTDTVRLVPITIVDPTDPAVDDFRSLTDVELRSRLEPEHGLFIAESEKVIRRAISAGYRARAFLLEPRWYAGLADVLEPAEQSGVPVLLAEQDVLARVAAYRVHRGALASMARRPLRPFGEIITAAHRVIVLEDIVDHTNVGAVFRSAAALDVDAVLVTPSCADPLYRSSIRVSMGTVFQVRWTRLESWPGAIASLQDAGFVVAALALAADAMTLDEFAATSPNKVAIVLGTEGDGLAPRTVAGCDVVVRIPMSGAVDSLNVAAAGAVVFWALRR
jgi:tRNA G18 (ribose-2'-O)-methylase SpoU